VNGVERKNRKKEELIFKAKRALKRGRYGRHSFVGHFASLTFQHSGQPNAGRMGSVLHRSLQTIGKLSLTTSNVLPLTPAIFRQKF
jgi:hypothetical protein